MMINIKKIILPNSITLHKGFLDHSFCDYVANNFKDYFEYTPRSEWNAYTLRDKNLPLYSEILLKFSPLVDYEFITTWINVTEYTKGIELRHHKDSESSLTIVSEISDNYTGGRFLINKESYTDDNYSIIQLDKGDVLTFDGSKVFHGVEEVDKGTRLSLNMWTKPKDANLI